MIRPGEDSDLIDVGALHARSRASAYSRILPPAALAGFPAGAMGEYWVERWRYEREDHQLTVAEADGDLLGFTYLGPDEEPGVGILNAIHVAPEAVGQGVGRALMLDALDKLTARGWSRAVLWVLAANARARRFYERGGWALDGAERVEYFGPVAVPQVRYARLLTP
ncbi:GNAT family N-acetyltransferase [Actinomycetes bacterium KLBMP 9797]